MVLKNYKYIKLLFLNTLRCNYLPTRKKQKQNNIFYLYQAGYIYTQAQ